MATVLRSNQVKLYRQQRGWSQADLAGRAGVSRTEVSAVEVGRLVPSVATALALARALGRRVEDLFGGPEAAAPSWAWSPRSPCRYWEAELHGRVLRYPVESTAAGVLAHDGVYDGDLRPGGMSEPARTLVVASCDPASALLATEYQRKTGLRMIVLPRSSRAALELLKRGLVHVAGVHFATSAHPRANADAVRDCVGPGHSLFRLARWQEGLSLSSAARVRSVEGVKRARLRWVGREPGSAARECQDELLPSRAAPRRVAHDHRGVAEAVRAGWADVGVCVRLVSEEAGLSFLPVREEVCELCFPSDAAGDPRIAALLRLVRSPEYRELLGQLPGYDASDTGELAAIR